MIHYLPLERLEMRYTAHLDDAITGYLDGAGLEYRRYYPDMGGRETEPPPPGYFLNAQATIEFKALQIAELARQGWQDNDLVFCSDLWFPGLEGLAYIAYFARQPFRLRGLLHAGSFTDTDFVRDLERWAAPFETVIFDIAERVYVGSGFACGEVCRKRLIDPAKVEATGFPLDPVLDFWITPTARDPVVVFNGRLADEKQPWLFDELAKRIKGPVEFRSTQAERLIKDDYYELLGRAKVVVSFALQENFGFGILEAVRLGCVPVMPNRLVYPDFFPAEYLYRTFDEAAALVEKALAGRLPVPDVPDFADAPARWFS